MKSISHEGIFHEPNIKGFKRMFVYYESKDVVDI